MSAIKRTALATMLGCATLVSGAANAAASFTFNGGYGASSAFNVISSNVNATSTYTAASAVTSIDQLIGQTVGLSDISTAGSVNSFLVGTTPLTVANYGGFGSDYTLGFSYVLNGVASIVDGGGVAQFQDGTLDKATVNAIPLVGYGTSDGEIDGAMYSCGAASTSGFCGLDAIFPVFTNGTIKITLHDIAANTDKQVLQLKLASATSNGQNVVLKTTVDYSWYAGGDAEVDNFASFVDPVNGFNRWYDIWNSSTPVDPIEILLRTDFNIDPNLVPTSAGCGANAAANTLCRTTNLNLTSVASVPEPASLALIGLGLLGLAGSRRKMRK